jgi:hypothetical protein
MATDKWKTAHLARRGGELIVERNLDGFEWDGFEGLFDLNVESRGEKQC